MRNFTEYINAKHGNDLWQAVALHVEGNPAALELSSYSVESPDEAELADLKIHRIRTHDTIGAALDFDIVVDTEIETAETINRDRKTGGRSQMFRISCKAMLDGGLHNLTMGQIEVYDHLKSSFSAEMADDFVPNIFPKDLEQEAELFLEQHYPEALQSPKPIDVYEIVRRIGLSVTQETLSDDGSIFGQISFADKEISIDPVASHMRGIGSVHNTIIHECFHWHRHKKTFELQKLLNQNDTGFRCQAVAGQKPEKKWNVTDRMEWQARSITPRILMPRKQTNIKITELINLHMIRMETDKLFHVIESVIEDLATFFGVSRLAAKIRMIDLGYDIAVGAFTFMDGRYVASHTWSKGALQKTQTFTITSQDALLQYAINADLRQMIESGKYVYADSRYCINDPKYVHQNAEGRLVLTEYANAHTDECCLVFEFETKVSTGRDTAEFYTECILYRNGKNQATVAVKYTHAEQNQIVDARAESALLVASKHTTDIMNSLPSTFSGKLVAHMDRLGLTNEKLAERALTSARTIQRMRTDEGYGKSHKNVVALCIGLNLNPVLSDDLLSKAGIAFQNTQEHIAYRFVLATHYDSSIIECNRLLEEAGLAPIGREE